MLGNAAVLDPEAGSLTEGQAVVVEGGRVVEVGPASAVRAGEATVLDVKGRTVMPGLIDAHVHVYAATADLGALEEWTPSYLTARAAGILRGMLDRGFTTVRDVAGADHGIAAAVSEGLFAGPRVIFGGRALSQTGGHGDSRGPGRDLLDQHPYAPALTVVADGVTEVRRATREQLRRGAHHVKVMLSGGIASPTDRIDSTQYSMEELRAIVEEAQAANRYVTGHAYTAAAVNRGLEAGVGCIEHGNLMDGSSIELFKRTGAFYVPTLATYAALADEGLEHGMPAAQHVKVFEVLDAGLGALELAARAGLPIVYGTDLLGGMHRRQLTELTIRSEVQPAADVLRSATTVAARLLGLQGQVGVVAPGALADLLVVDGNPLERLGLLTHPARNLRLVMAAGRVHRNDLD
ncbi:MAG TPA: amidohydrolase family protein [Actinomycetes bacterium]|nr:amidohydrolase family protein [Actinomycetes bacterium]